jgi:DNA polymerase-3 subunit delta'
MSEEAETEAEQHPRFCQQVLGHDAVFDQINISSEGRSHQSFLFSGPRGIGKASSAWTLAARMLSKKEGGLLEEATPASIDPAEKALIEAGSHPDLLAIEPDPERASMTISIDQIRTITPFLSHHPARGGWRIVIIDALDDVNYNGANAMLKTLEEPPERALIILINHETRPVLATIRSRCYVARFSPLDFETSRGVISRNFPDVSQDWLDVASVLAEGAPGKAMLFAESGAVDLYAETCTLISASQSGAQAVDEMARQWGAGGAKNHSRRQTAMLVFDRLLARAARYAGGMARNADEPTMDLEEQAVAAINARINADEIAAMHQTILKQLTEAETLNLDAAVPLYAMINRLCGNSN